MNGELALSVVVFEKALDMVSLLLWGALACTYVGLVRPQMMILAIPVVLLLALFLLIVLPLPLFPSLIRLVAAWLPRRFAVRLERLAQGSSRIAAWFWQRPARAIGVAALSVALWGAHLLQFWLFTKAVGGNVPLLDNMAFATLSIVVGLLPFTFAGIGSRDVAIVYFFSSYLAPGAGAFLGILATLRYVLPAVVGIPFVSDLATAAAALRSRRPAEAGSRAGER